MTTSSGGAFTGYTTDNVNGVIHQIKYTKTDFADGSTMTLTGENSGLAIWAQTGMNASTTFAPRQATHTTAGVATTYDGTRAVLAPIAVGGERLKIVVTSGGANKTGALDIWVG